MNALPEQVLRIATTYLGPAAKIFLERQTKFHLGGLELASIQAEHLPKLIYWIHVSAKLIIKEKADLLAAQLMKELRVAQMEKGF